jgi:hypothetical protein
MEKWPSAVCEKDKQLRVIKLCRIISSTCHLVPSILIFKEGKGASVGTGMESKFCEGYREVLLKGKAQYV